MILSAINKKNNKSHNTKKYLNYTESVKTIEKIALVRKLYFFDNNT